MSRTRIQFQCGFNEDDYQELLSVQNLVSRSKQTHCDFEQTIMELVRFYKEAKDPVKKAERAQERMNKQHKQPEQSQPEQDHEQQQYAAARRGPEHVNSNRRTLPAQLEHQINLRDQNQCVFQHREGKRCEEKRWLDYHHKILISNGGQDTLENLQTLYRGHHQMIHSTHKHFKQENLDVTKYQQSKEVRDQYREYNIAPAQNRYREHLRTAGYSRPKRLPQICNQIIGVLDPH